MMFKPEFRGVKAIGHSLAVGKCFFFFGNRFLAREEMKSAFPDFEFAYLKQVHGKAVLNGDASTTQEGDAHFTSKENLALVSQSADCAPILLGNDLTVCAIHSGWRGTAQNIVGATKMAFPQLPPTAAAIGPHILLQSFEVGKDVAEQLLKAAPSVDGLVLPHADPAKAYFDLTELLRRQLREAFGAGITIHEHLADTVTDSNYHSYRRGKQLADRQFSFVVLKA